MRRQVGRLTLGLTVPDRWELTSGNPEFSLAPLGSQPQAQSQTHSITGTICTQVPVQWTICNGMFTVIVVAPVCRLKSLMESISGSVAVQRGHVGMYMAIPRVMHSLSGRCGMMYKIARQNSDSKQKCQGMRRILEGRAKTCKHTPQGAANHAPVRIRRHQGKSGREVPVGEQLTHTHPRSGSLSLPWDQITHTFAVSMAATPVAQHRMGFKAPRLHKNEGVSRPTWFARIRQQGK